MSLSTQPIKGARDIYPPEKALQNWFFDQWRRVSHAFGYQEYDAPILEPLELFEKKSSEEIVNQQTFILTDRSGQKLTLRPEMTPSLARMVAAKRKTLEKPIRWFSLPSCWRYEQPQKGRSREFVQYNADILGTDSIAADAEILSLGVKLLESVAFNKNDFVIRISDRSYIQSRLVSFGIAEDLIPAIFSIIDRKEKIETRVFDELLANEGVNDEQRKKINALLEEKEFSASPRLTRLFTLLDAYDIRSCAVFDPTIVRGFLYYTSTVFEFFANTSALRRSLFGGGRYDNLVGMFGGEKLSGIGFAFSDVMIETALKELGKLPTVPVPAATVFIPLMGADLSVPTITLANELRRKNISVELALEPGKIDKQLKNAGAKGIHIAVIVGEDEVKEKSVQVKNLETREQLELSQTALGEYLKSKLFVPSS